jgi:uncharacterized membrane protein
VPFPELSFGQRVADKLTALVGSWHFIIVQSLLLLIWLAANIWAWFGGWDPYPFILLNLVLSFQAAYTAPVIMMSQNRQAALDRRNAENDYKINVKAELEIELLHHKLDLLREQIGTDPPGEDPRRTLRQARPAAISEGADDRSLAPRIATCRAA